MKKIILFTFVSTFIITGLFCQTPGLFNYQAIIRDANGNIISEKDFDVRISIYKYQPNGIIIYQEQFQETSNKFGLINLKIGSGVSYIGTFDEIDWSDGPIYLETAIDSTLDYNFIVISNTQLVSVPYALHSQTVEIDQVEDADADPENELQNLELQGNTLSIENGNSVEIPMDGLWNLNGNDIYYSNGNVGIGTNIPESGLHIETQSEYTSGRVLINLHNKSTDSHSTCNFYLKAGNNNGSLLSIGHASDNYTAVPGRNNCSHIWNRGRGLSLRSTGSEACITFETSQSETIIERMRIDSQGNLGIGTTEPKSKLHIAEGDIYLEDINSGVIMKSGDGQCWRIKVNNNGILTTESISCP